MTKDLKKYIFQHIRSLGIKKNDKLLVYSDLSKFGINNIKITQIIISSLKKIIGIKGTIIMPFYILGKENKYIFNKKKFIFSKKIASLTKKFCSERNLIRSNSMIHNHIGIGPSAKILNFSKDTVSLGKGSDFELMKKNNFKLILLGCEPNQGATYLHHLEAIYGVPYRKWITIKKKKMAGKKVQVILIRYFAKKNDSYVSNFNIIFKHNKKLKKYLKTKKIKYGRSYSIYLKDLHKIGLSILKKDKYYFVKKK